jgi:threonine/homoserine/homoserine lactone efflux protein
MLIWIILLSILDIIGVSFIIYSAYNLWINRKGKK